MNALCEINLLVKSAGYISQDGKTFTLPQGKAPWHVINEWNAAHPDSKISFGDISSANGNLAAGKFRSGKAYNMPSRVSVATASKPVAAQSTTVASTVAPPESINAAYRANNMFNMRNYLQKWLGEVTGGVEKGEMLGFKTPWHGYRAGARNVANLMKRLTSKGKKATIRNFTPIFSPASENNVPKHMANISRLSGIGIDDAIDLKDENTFYNLLRGLAQAESGNKALSGLTKEQMMDAIRSAGKSL